MNNKNIVIIDYGLGNLFSVNQACQTVGLNVKIPNIKEEIRNADAIIFPGVGAFIEAMNNLEKYESEIKNINISYFKSLFHFYQSIIHN